jgi:large subunit ribosomal protein L21
LRFDTDFRFSILGLFQKCLISSTPAFQNKLTTAQPLQVAKMDASKDPIKNINEKLKKDEAGRLFAVVHICGKQFKVTAGDIILIEGHWEPSNGDELKLEKVLLCGSQDFTLVGRPILQKDLVDVQATVIEKSLSHTRTHFKFKKRKQYRRINFQRQITTTLRINSIEIKSLVDQSKAESLNNVFY